MRRWWCCLLLVGLAAGLGTRAAGAGAWTTLLRANSYTDLLLANDTLWCATLEGGLVRYDAVRDRFTSFTREPGGLQSNRLSALALDRAGRLWVGTQGAGVSRLEPDRASWDLLSGFDGIPSDTITVLEAEGDTVYVGTTRGIALWDGNTVAGAIPDGVNPSPFASNYINGVAQLGDSVWVSTLAGIYVSRLSDLPLTWSAVNQGLIAPAPLALARAGLELFTLVGNLPFRFDFEAGQWRTAGNWQAIGGVARMSDHQGVVALATVNGIYRWDPGAPPPFAGAPPGDWALVQGGPEYSSSLAGDTRAVFAITADPTGTVLYAANRKGIHTLTRGCTECPVHAPPGPPGNNIINLALQSTTLYVNTFNEGVGRFDGSGWRLWLPGSCSGSVWWTARERSGWRAGTARSRSSTMPRHRRASSTITKPGRIRSPRRYGTRSVGPRRSIRAAGTGSGSRPMAAPIP